MKKAFTLVELLVVVAILALLLTFIAPALDRARLQAKVTAVNAELFQIGFALEAYGFEHEGKFPPTRVSCMIQSHYYQLPDELVQQRYLPGRPEEHGPMSSAFEDRFNTGHTYKYVAPGDLILNQGHKPLKNKSCLWVPDGFPDNENPEEGKFYYIPQESPVSWAVYSLGPNFDADDPEVIALRYPVPCKTWYAPQKRKGFLTRIRLSDGEHIGTFEGD